MALMLGRSEAGPVGGRMRFNRAGSSVARALARSAMGGAYAAVASRANRHCGKLMRVVRGLRGALERFGSGGGRIVHLRDGDRGRTAVPAARVAPARTEAR